MGKLVRIICVTLLFFSCRGKGQNLSEPNVSIEKKLIDSHLTIDPLANQFLKTTKLPGISIAVGREGKVLFAKGYGYADIENKVPMSTETQLRTASVAKVITATALGRLVTEGNLDWDMPIGNYVPYLKKPFPKLTTRQLAGHTSGVQHRPPREKLENKQYSNIKETVQLFAETDLVFEPDTDYEYSTNGFNLLSAVIEGASGQTYMDYMRNEIFNPLGMAQTYPEDITNLSDKDAKLYYFKDNELVLDTELSNGSYKLAGAGFRSTPTDLVKMMEAYSNGLIAPKIVQEMFTSHQLKNGEKTNVGIAWRTSFDPFGNMLVDHAGSWQGARTVVVYYPEEKLGIALMINAQCQIFIEETAHLLLQAFLNDKTGNSPIGKLNQKVTVTNNRSNSTVETYEGELSLDENGNGLLTMDTEIEFLKSIPVQYLGFENHYVAQTSYGMLYLSLTQEPVLNGKLYMYQNRNETNPVNKKETLSFRAN